MKTTIEDETLEIFSSIAQFSNQKPVKKADLAEVRFIGCFTFFDWPDSGSADSYVVDYWMIGWLIVLQNFLVNGTVSLSALIFRSQEPKWLRFGCSEKDTWIWRTRDPWFRSALSHTEKCPVFHNAVVFPLEPFSLSIPRWTKVLYISSLVAISVR